MEFLPEAEASQNPARNRQRTDEISAEVRGLEPGSSRRCDIECGLEVAIQDVEKTVRKAPEEEEDGHCQSCQRDP
jgi:hypothetical protein